MESTENLLGNDLQVDPEVQQHLTETAKWAKFLAIIGYIFSGILFLAGLINIMNDSNRNSGSYYYGRRTETMSPMISFIILTVLSIIWFFASLYIYRFATKMQTAFQQTDQQSFNDALANLSKNYKLLGITTIIYLAIIVLATIVGIAS